MYRKVKYILIIFFTFLMTYSCDEKLIILPEKVKISADFVSFAKSKGIPVGPGRGSGAGSIAAYCMEITDLDPMKYNLLFERFLNPERVSMPDFDVDFCQDRRDEVIDYVKDKYGADRVAHIITFGKLQARAVLRDVGRVLQMPYGQVDKITKSIRKLTEINLEACQNIDVAVRELRDLKKMKNS